MIHHHQELCWRSDHLSGRSFPSQCLPSGQENHLLVRKWGGDNDHDKMKIMIMMMIMIKMIVIVKMGVEILMTLISKKMMLMRTMMMMMKTTTTMMMMMMMTMTGSSGGDSPRLHRHRRLQANPRDGWMVIIAIIVIITTIISIITKTMISIN